jgi:SAM-dependent methyltransferase
MPPQPRSAEYFDGWYADQAATPAVAEITNRHMGFARKTGASLIGVDFSAGALAEARDQAVRMGVRDASFRVGALTATGLPAASVEAVLCTDAIQFADELAYDEIRRVLKPGGRVVLTCWEALDRDDERLGLRIRRANLDAGLRQAGFTDVEVRDRPSWLAREHALWEEAVTLDPGDDPALRSLHAEGVKSLQWIALLRRVLAVATSPQ